jgi:hypothetical protein
MDQVTENLSNGNKKTYKIVNGTAYSVGMTLSGTDVLLREETPTEIVNVLESVRQSGELVRVFYGDRETGKDWMEEHDVKGRISRSTGRIKIPILVAPRASGGPGLLDNCIVKIVRCRDKSVLYRHPKYNQAKITIRDTQPGEKIGNVDLLSKGLRYVAEHDGELAATFKTRKTAERYQAFMQGA